MAEPIDKRPPKDVGRTSGGGSLGHDQPDDVEEQTHVRNRGGTSRERMGTQRETPEPAPELND